LVEDNLVNQLVVRRMLEKAGTNVEIAENGLQALAAVERKHYDLVFMDVQMPEMDGYQTTIEIRRREGTARHTPIIALTAHAMPEDRGRCLAAGMDDYLSKPVAPEDLQGALRRWGRTGASRDRVETGSFPVPLQPPRYRCEIFDGDAALAQAGGDPALLLRSINVFQAESGRVLAEIRSALSRRDPRVVERSAGQLKSSLSALAARAAPAAAALVESLGQKGDLAQAGQAIASLEREVVSLEGELARFTTRGL